MRGAFAAVLALLMLGGLPAPGAQAQAPGVSILEDNSGDIQATVAGNQVGSPAGRFAATDLKGLVVEETATDLVFRLTVASLAASPEAPLAENTMYTVDFAHETMVYRVMMYRGVTGVGDPQYGGRLYAYDKGRDTYSPLEQLPVTADVGSGTVSTSVPRLLLLDKQGAAPFPGRVLTGFWAQSASMPLSDRPIPVPPGSSTEIPSTGVRDAMPDTGVGTVSLPIRLGLQQGGVARLSAAVPVRASNGEATTFVFAVNATNLGPAQRFALATVGAPASWQVQLPSDLVELPANGTVVLPVLVSMPFAHAHGTLQSFTLEMAGLDNPADVGRVQLGVRFVQPPQPAGHHDTQYLHAFGSDGDQTFTTVFSTLFGFDPNQLYFNTLTPDEDPNDAKVPVGGFTMSQFGAVPPATTYTWTVPLSPGLALGLDFDLFRQGSIRLAANTVVPMTGAVLTGRIVHTVPDERNCDGRFGRGGDRDECGFDDFFFGAGAHATVATIGPSAPQDVAANTNGALFEAPITATQAGDYVLFHPDATLGLMLNISYTMVDPFIGPDTAPKVAGGEMVLPLNEYHDPVDQVFSSLSSLMIHVHGDQQRLVNPGKTVLYNLELMNHAEGTASYDLELSGQGSHWAQVVGDRRVTIEGGQSRALGIAVTAPADAPDGAVSDVVLTAIDTRDPSARTLARLLTTVDTEAEHADESSLVPGLAEQLSKKDAPGAGLPLAALALAALALALRRRA